MNAASATIPARTMWMGRMVFPIVVGGAPAPDPEHRGKHSGKRSEKPAEETEGRGHWEWKGCVWGEF